MSIKVVIQSLNQRWDQLWVAITFAEAGEPEAALAWLRPTATPPAAPSVPLPPLSRLALH